MCQEVSTGYSSVFSWSSNLNSPTSQEQSGVLVGTDDDVGLTEVDGDVDGTPRLGSHGISILLES